jgi:hypothetical protein
MYIETRYDRGIKDTLLQVQALSAPEVGETVFCRENGRVLTFDGDLWMCDDFIKVYNQSPPYGSSLSQGDTMVFFQGSGTGPRVERTTTTGSARVAGVCVYNIGNNSNIALAFKGVYKVKLLYYSTPTAIGGFIRSSSGGGGGNSEVATTMASGMFGWTLEIAPTPSTTVPSLVRCLLRGKVEYYF